jgi:hypothetical protein
MSTRKTIKRKPTASKPKLPRAHYPKGWNRKRAEALAAHYDNQADDEAIAEAEAAYNSPGSTMMQIPIALVPAVQKLLATKAG